MYLLNLGVKGLPNAKTSHRDCLEFAISRSRKFPTVSLTQELRQLGPGVGQYLLEGLLEAPGHVKLGPGVGQYSLEGLLEAPGHVKLGPGVGQYSLEGLLEAPGHVKLGPGVGQYSLEGLLETPGHVKLGPGVGQYSLEGLLETPGHVKLGPGVGQYWLEGLLEAPGHVKLVPGVGQYLLESLPEAPGHVKLQPAVRQVAEDVLDLLEHAELVVFPLLLLVLGAGVVVVVLAVFGLVARVRRALALGFLVRLSVQQLLVLLHQRPLHAQDALAQLRDHEQLCTHIKQHGQPGIGRNRYETWRKTGKKKNEQNKTKQSKANERWMEENASENRLGSESVGFSYLTQIAHK